MRSRAVFVRVHQLDPTPIRDAIVPWVAPHSSTSASKTKRWSSLLLTCASTNFKVGWDLKWTKQKTAKTEEQLPMISFWIWEIDEMSWGYPSKTAVIRKGALDRRRKATNEHQNTCGEMIEDSKVAWLFCGRMRRNLQIWSNIIWLQLLKFSRYH